MILLLIIAFFIMMLLGIPVAFSMLGSSLVYILVGMQTEIPCCSQPQFSVWKLQWTVSR